MHKSLIVTLMFTVTLFIVNRKPIYYYFRVAKKAINATSYLEINKTKYEILSLQESSEVCVWVCVCCVLGCALIIG